MTDLASSAFWFRWPNPPASGVRLSKYDGLGWQAGDGGYIFSTTGPCPAASVMDGIVNDTANPKFFAAERFRPAHQEGELRANAEQFCSTSPAT